MRSALIKVYKVVHTWAGIVAGLGLFICFYAGAFTVFKDPLARWATPPAERASSKPRSSAELHALVTTTLAQHPEVAEEFTLTLEAAPAQAPSPMSWHRSEGDEDHDTLAERQFHATLQANGAAVVTEGHPSKVGEFIDVLHRVVGLPFDTEVGRVLTGVISLLYALALLSGLVIVLPSLVKDFFALRVGKGLKRWWMDAHNVVGIASLPFHLLIAITAAVFGLHDIIYDVQDQLIHGGTLRAGFRPAAGDVRSAPDPTTMLPPAELLARARVAAPALEPHSLQYVKVATPRALVRVWGHDPAALSPRALGGFVALDPYSGKVRSTDFLPGQMSAPVTLISSFFALHFGTFGGPPVKWIYFLLALSGAWLFYSGNVLWVETRRKKARAAGELPVQRRDVRWMAALTVGICLGCVSGISFTLVLAKWLGAHVADVRVFHQYGYYAVFFASIGYALARGAARASIDLLWGAALCTLAIPLTTVVGWLVPGLGPWATLDGLGVDLTALLGAFCFAWMARATSRRAHTGPQDSVWSLGAPAASPGQEPSVPKEWAT
ncbi:PepSY-associated TM helix domain-containing protein [Myxococcus fulvus]|uniref:PepSY-associated TM helix domain-containing protein n=1 Tax=Myxococcus fulvus TaxID=33 RepID=UPI0020C1865F|nr:PepSY-associated TM helix domain-containing protein [Myxococcus fulvus]MCK8500239.1 PepSY domain-containing protein [Myxococcus fulvus]